MATRYNRKRDRQSTQKIEQLQISCLRNHSALDWFGARERQNHTKPRQPVRLNQYRPGKQQLKGTNVSRDAVETLMDRWINEPGFRAEMRANPEGAVKAAGIQLDEDELAALKAVDFNLADEELQARVSKAGA
jgi:hypothetical protein